MTVQAIYILCLCLAAACIVAAAVMGVLVHKASLKTDETLKSRPTVTPFHVFLICFFIAAVIVFFPTHITQAESENGFVAFISSLLLSVLNTMQIFFLNGDFSPITDAVSELGGLGTGYSIAASIVFVTAPVLTFGFILSFFRETIAMLKYHLHPFTDIYVMSELNANSIELAKDIIATRGSRKCQIVFTDVFEKDDEEIFELIAEAKRLGAICLKKDIVELNLKRTAINRKLFFISTDEDENLRQALTIINRCRETPRYNNRNTQFFVFACNVESEALLDSVDNGNMKVRRINERHNLILHTLSERSVFENAIERDGVKHITAVIIGLGTYGTALLKILCWLCQMPGYELTLHVFEYGDGEAKIRSIAPELCKLNNTRVHGEPYYNMVFHNNIDATSPEFAAEISAIDDVTAAFVTLGTDEQNIELAMKLRMLFACKDLTRTEPFPPIYTVVYSALKNKTVMRNGGLKGLPDKAYNNSYGIEFIGDISTRYSMTVIEQSEIEDAGLACHVKWVAEGDEAGMKQSRMLYEKYEYFRRASIAESVHHKHMDALGLIGHNADGSIDTQTAMYEHMRWSAYMRSEGYVSNDLGIKNHIAKTHHNLRPFNDLSKKDKDKDYRVKSK